MKRLFFVVLALGLSTAAFAQSGAGSTTPSSGSMDSSSEMGSKSSTTEVEKEESESKMKDGANNQQRMEESDASDAKDVDTHYDETKKPSSDSPSTTSP